MQDTRLPPVPTARVVVFMTQERWDDVPGEDCLLACLLPLGTASFAARVMDSCALAGVRQIDVVVSEHPEALRSLLQDGTPWGLRLNWHHAKQSASPYAVLRGIGLGRQEHIVVGHAHQWVASRIVRELMQATSVAMHVGTDVVWTGWFSASAGFVLGMGLHEDYTSLAVRVRSMDTARCVIAAQADFAPNLCAADLLAAQQHALDGTQESAVPASWLRKSWGAASPDAVIHAAAHIRGPVLVGAGCVVESGAELGPCAVLAHDVFVASGARVQHALVMANTYVSGQIALEYALAQGHSVQSLKWDVRAVLSPGDAVMVPLRARANPFTPWTSRTLAALLAAALLPLLLPMLMLQKWATGHVLWRTLQAVQSRIAGQDRLVMQAVRQARSQQALDCWVAYFGGLLDIVQGRRSWFGLRPRSESEWYALGRDWQELFSRTAIGLFHAPAWTEDSENLDSEAYAAADAFMAVQSTVSHRVRILCKQTWGSR